MKFLLSIILSLFFSLSAYSQTVYHPEVLEDIIKKVEIDVAAGKHPVVLFDLDDTLINTRERNLRIIVDFRNLPETKEKFSDDLEKLNQITLDQIRYNLTDTLHAVGINNPELEKAASDFWLPRFFSNEYSAQDKQNTGAANYLHELSREGAYIVYLTGRDVPRMQEGTIEGLKHNFFPLAKNKALLMMKPDKSIDDLKFKQDSFEQIKSFGDIVGVFENEPANINAMTEAFPEADAVFLDTIHSSNPDVPHDNVMWVKNFKH